MNTRQQKKSSTSFSVFSFFKTRRPRRSVESDAYTYGYDDAMYSNSRKVRPLEDDKGPWLAVADPRIDTKASAFIANFHATRFSESERQIYQNNSSGVA